MKNEDKKAVSKLFGVGYTYFESWIENISYVRNICAHYGRLYNAILSKTPTLYKQYIELGVSNNRVFSTLLCLKHLLPMDRHWDEFVENISNLLYKYPKADKFKIGFIETWEDVLLGKM
jgi:abortive infection bacteriophage resistance protein